MIKRMPASITAKVTTPTLTNSGAVTAFFSFTFSYVAVAVIEYSYPAFSLMYKL